MTQRTTAIIAAILIAVSFWYGRQLGRNQGLQKMVEIISSTIDEPPAREKTDNGTVMRIHGEKRELLILIGKNNEVLSEVRDITSTTK